MIREPIIDENDWNDENGGQKKGEERGRERKKKKKSFVEGIFSEYAGKNFH